MNTHKIADMWISLAERFPELMEKYSLYTDIGDHLKFLAKKANAGILRYVLPNIYAIDIIKELIPYHISTIPIEMTQGSPPTLSLFFQPSNEIVIQMILGVKDPNDTDYVVAVHMHTVKPSHAVEFLKTHKTFAVDPNRKTLGFPGI